MRRLHLTAAAAGLFALSLGTADAQDWVTVKGQIKLSQPPAPEPVPADKITADKPHCESKGPVVYETLVVNPTSKGVKNVVVWLRPDDEDRKAVFPANKIHPDLAKPAPKTVVVDQPCCQFEPRVVAVRDGDTIEFKNSAPVNHNVNFNSDAEQINPNLPPNTSVKSKPVQAQRLPATFACNIHPWMKGYARIFDHPYYAVTDADGKFEITNAPAGNWRLVVWQENGYHKGKEGVLGTPVVLKGPATELPAIELELPKP